MRPRMKPKKNREDETLAERKARKELSSRGKSAESKTHDILLRWSKKNRQFDFDRLLDSKAAGKLVAAQVSDFLLFYKGRAASLEIKEMKTGLRLPKKSFPQHGRMMRREYAGCRGFLVVNTKDTNLWWVIRVTDMLLGAVSWRVDECGGNFEDAEAAMRAIKRNIIY